MRSLTCGAVMLRRHRHLRAACVIVLGGLCNEPTPMTKRSPPTTPRCSIYRSCRWPGGRIDVRGRLSEGKPEAFAQFLRHFAYLRLHSNCDQPSTSMLV